MDERAHQLKTEGPTAFLAEIDALCQAHPEAEGLAEHLGYLRKREGQMQYPTHRAQGLPMGSGAMESANKPVVEDRLKGSGMHWARRHVDPMLALRNAVCSDRWAEAWEQIACGLRAQGGRRQAARREQRATTAGPAAGASLVAAAPTPREPGSEKPATAPKPGPPAGAGRRPAAEHPWRRFHIGRATDPPRAGMTCANQ